MLDRSIEKENNWINLLYRTIFGLCIFIVLDLRLRGSRAIC